MTSGVPFDDWYKDQFVEKVREGFPPRLARLELETPFEWRTVKAHLDTDTDFRDRVNDALADANASVEHAVFKEAKAGNLGAARLWLANKGEGWVDERNHGAKPPGGVGGVGAIVVSVDALREMLTAPDTRGGVIEAAGFLSPAELEEGGG